MASRPDDFWDHAKQWNAYQKRGNVPLAKKIAVGHSSIRFRNKGVMFGHVDMAILPVAGIMGYRKGTKSGRKAAAKGLIRRQPVPYAKGMAKGFKKGY